MANISDVIGWKFELQSGMCCKTNKKTGKLEITQFPGGIPSKKLQKKWTKEYENYLLKSEAPNVPPLN